ncbi:MAG: hypothetical protein O7F71_09110 [Gammaproteobacteria bacterium]|nr:hypothetical protein [Gammaproteobacteria bacterium]
MSTTGEPIDNVISLLESDIERLKESLETYRLTKSPNRDELIRWHVRTLDERQDALEELLGLVLARKNSGEAS